VRLNLPSLLLSARVALRCAPFTHSNRKQTLEALDIFRAAARLPIIPVIEMLHQTTFWKIRVPSYTIIPIFLHKQSQDREKADLRSKERWAMRESLGNEIPVPYTEWLAVGGFIVVAVVVCESFSQTAS
jgi:hypothetical protein